MPDHPSPALPPPAAAVELTAGDYAARLLPAAGAAFAALRWRGHDLLVPIPTGGDPNTGFAGAFLMLPWANRLDAGLLPHAGVGHHLPINRPDDATAIHGLARDRPWTVVTADAAEVVLTQTLDDEAPNAPPQHYTARLEVRLGAAGLALSLTLTNRGVHAFPFGLGWHPWFPRPPGTRLRFAATTRFGRDARCLPVAPEPSPGIAGDEATYRGLDTHFAGWDGAADLALPALTLRLRATGAWATNLQVFAPADDAVLCVEPVSHVPDAPNRPALAVHGPLTVLAPGASLHAALTLGVA